MLGASARPTACTPRGRRTTRSWGAARGDDRTRGPASRRLAWEYYFNFDGGSPPWTSAMSQATGLEAFSRAYKATRRPGLAAVARQAMPIFTVPPPAGVQVPTASGVRYLQYTFAPGVSIINAFLQSLIGLDDYGQASGDAKRGRLFAAGNAEAQAEVPHFDAGAWSLYQPGVEDPLSYHELVTGFLQQLCTTDQRAGVLHHRAGVHRRPVHAPRAHRT